MNTHTNETLESNTQMSNLYFLPNCQSLPPAFYVSSRLNELSNDFDEPIIYTYLVNMQSGLEMPTSGRMGLLVLHLQNILLTFDKEAIDQAVELIYNNKYNQIFEDKAE